MLRLAIIHLLLILAINLSAQNKHINFVLFIDNELVPSSEIYEGVFILSTKDTIPIKYELGELLLDEHHYEKLAVSSNNAELQFNFSIERQVQILSIILILLA